MEEERDKGKTKNGIFGPGDQGGLQQVEGESRTTWRMGHDPACKQGREPKEVHDLRP